MLALSLTCLVSSASAFAECKWTAQEPEMKFKTKRMGKDGKLAEVEIPFKLDDVYSQPPQIEKGECRADGKPTCAGYVFCMSGKAMSIGAVACNAVKAGDKWKCPDGQTCFTDPNVMISALKEIPGPKSDSAEPPASGTVK
jgi:hypothetical protein